MSPPTRYPITVSHVREIALSGGADLGYWREQLRGERLQPAERAGQAELHVGATSARFLGVTFRELVICVFLRQPEGIYLTHAFNSVRAFAWFERTLFHTPYRPARISLDLAPAPAWEVSQASGRLLRAAMSAESATALRAAGPGTDVVWEVPVHLPGLRANRGPGKLFYARLSGVTQTVAFAPDRDTFEIPPAVDDGALRSLLDSQFSPREWIIRAEATHSKSKTVRRPAAS